MEYFESDVPGGNGLCSDNACPCPEVEIPRGTGYLYIEQSLVDFRRQYPKLDSARRAMQQMQEQMRSGGTGGIFSGITGGFYRLGPILVCEQGAKLRNLDLEVAAADAKHWWKTGLVPLRATPLAGSSKIKKGKSTPKAKPIIKVDKAIEGAVKASKTQNIENKKVQPKPGKPKVTNLEKSEVKGTEAEKAAEKPPREKGAQTDTRLSLWLAIANLNISGLGYWLSGERKRGILFVGVGVALLFAGHIANASKNPLLWGLMCLALFIGMAVDLWFLLKKREIKLPPLLQRSASLLPAVALLVNVVFYGCFLLYRSAGNNLYQAGLVAQEKNDVYGVFSNWYALSNYYRISLNSRVVEVQRPLGEVGLLINTRNLVGNSQFSAALEEIEHFITLYPDSLKKADMADIGVDAYVGWAQELDRQNEYEKGLEKLDSAQRYFPTQAGVHKQQLDSAYSAHYMAFGNYLIAQDKFGTAVEKLEYLMAAYPEATEYQAAYESAAQAYVGWSTQLAEQKDYVQAALNLDTVIDAYSKSKAVADARQMLPLAYLNCGKQLSDQYHYLLAMEKFESIKEIGASSALVNNADEEYQNTVLLLAKDDGEDGQKVVDEAQVQACNGEIPTHPSIGLLADEPGKVFNCCEVPGISDCSRWVMSSDLIATIPGSFRYTLLRTSSSRKVQSCAFTGWHTLERHQDMDEVVINLVATGEEVARKTFYGGSPPACPYVHFFNSMTDFLYGDQVKNPTIDEWIAQVIQ
jgi:tetratricopeptide (TPR) repeat protein